MARFTLLPGNQINGSDDRAGVWYIHVGSGAIDKRGPGFASRQDALESLLLQLSGVPVDDGPDLVSVSAIAHRAGQSEATVYAWIRRGIGFPEALIDFGPSLRRWDWSDVAAWLAVPRRPGRPAVSKPA